MLAGCGVGPLGDLGGGADPAAEARRAGSAFLADWAAGRYAAAAARTTDATAARAAMEGLQSALRPTARTLTAGELSGCRDDRPCVLSFDAVLALEALGDWRYGGTLTLIQGSPPADAGATGAPAPAGGGEADPGAPATSWQVRWQPSVIHPRLTPDTALRRTREMPERAPILDRDGKPLVSIQPVTRVGVAAGEVPTGTIEALAELTDVNVDGLRTRSNLAPKGQFVQAVVLRAEDFGAIESELAGIEGVVTQEDNLPLAPTREFARAVLGSVGEPTAEALRNAGPTASSADSVGTSGLQELYQKQLAGRPGGRVELIERGTGQVVDTLTEFTTAPGREVATTLDIDIQRAAEAALTRTEEAASLVAVDSATGEILAVANGPVDEAGEERALAGQYAPGSTFKIVTAAALLRAGLQPDDIVSCPPTVTVTGKQFENYDGLGALGDVPFRSAFANSCNTAFISEALELDAGALNEAADSFGIGRAWDIELNSFSGDVPTEAAEVDRAAAAIGQGRVLMSPLSMAIISAAVESGTPQVPSLVTSGPPLQQAPRADGGPTPAPAPTRRPGPQLDPLPEAETLRQLMETTVQSGSARVLFQADEEIGAKTGTAEWGSETEPGLHAWMTGYMDGVAFAVVVERGVSGAETAGPIANQFLQELDQLI